MWGEAILLGLLVALAATPLALRRSRKRMWLLGAALLLVVTVAASFAPRPGGVEESEVTNRPIRVEDDGYQSSSSCRSCHPGEYGSWHRSYHRTMTQVATPESVIGDFSGLVEANGRAYELVREGDEYWVEMEDPDWAAPGAPIIRRQIVMTTGSHLMQAYWYATGNSRMLGQLPLMYLKDRQRWVPRSAAFVAPRVRGSETARWNLVCVKCHATHGRQRLDDQSRFDTRVAELGIACEACHGPGKEHTQANRDPKSRYANRFNEADDTIVNPAKLPAERASQVCGQCHGIHYFYDEQSMRDWNRSGARYRPGDDLNDSKLVVRHSPHLGGAELAEIEAVYPQYRKRERFWSDGMVRISGRDYNAMIESPCYEPSGDFGCLSCHTMHPGDDDSRSLDEWANRQLTDGLDGNEACLQCHDDFSERVEEHGKHKPGSSGNLCLNCHMSYTTYGLLKAIRSHQISSPTVQASLETGRPNACNQCHLDQTLAWTAEYLQEWYEIAPPELNADERGVSAAVLWALQGDPGQRALMAWSMGWSEALEASGDEWMPAHLAQLMLDPYEAVRLIAEQSLRRHELFAELNYDPLAPLGQLGQTSREVVAAWFAGNPEIDPENYSRLLLTDSGELDREALQRLLADRDNRPLALKE